MDRDRYNFPACKINNTPPLPVKDSDDEVRDLTSIYPNLEFSLNTKEDLRYFGR